MTPIFVSAMFFASGPFRTLLRSTNFHRHRLRHAGAWLMLLVLALASLAADAVTLTAVQSRKVHGAAGTFNVDIDLSQTIGGAVTVEPRAIGDGHLLVFHFDAPVTNFGVPVATDETGAPIGTMTTTIAGNDVEVTLAGVADNKRVTVRLPAVNGADDAFASLGFLVGDVNNSMFRSSVDIAQIRSRSGQAVDGANFRFDLNATGMIGAADIAAIKARPARTLPAVSAPSTFTLIVSKTGAGSGTVTSVPVGINCGAVCSVAYNAGASITLTATAASGSTFGGWSGACSGTDSCSVTMNLAKAVAAGFALAGTPPPDPATVAPPTDPTAATSLATATTFLYTGPNPIQTGVVSGTIQPDRVAVLRGKVQARDGTPLSGVRISVLAHPEFGQTLTRADGAFDLATNGGGQLMVHYEKNGLLPVQRAIVAPWRDFAWLPDVVMIPFDSAATTVNLGAPGMQVARGNPVSDSAGSRRATILFPPGTNATLVLADGSTQPLSTVNVRATEFTTGDTGPKAMPAPLPPSSGYTYAAELSVDEAVAIGATEVRFSQALPVYVENFLGFPVGSAVPSGYYDRQIGQWIASANGRVIKVLGISGGLADLDTDGDAVTDDATKLAALGISDLERARLALLYTAGQTLWRIPVTHFTPWDWNWPFGPPLDAVSPPARPRNNPQIRRPTRRCGSVIGCEEQTLGESIPVAGTPWSLHYQSERTPGRREAYTLEIPISVASVPASLMEMRVSVSLAGKLYQASYAPAPNVVFSVLWDGRDAYGRLLYGEQTATVKVDYVYPLVYYPVDGALQALAFGRAAASGAAIDSPRGVYSYTYSQTWTEKVHVRDMRRYGQGGWSLSVQHAYDPVGRKLLLGNGEERRGTAMSQIINTFAGNGTYGFAGDGGPATTANFQNTHDIALGADGSLFIAEPGSNRVRRVGPDGIISTVAGNGLYGFGGDGVPATETRLAEPRGIAVGPDGSLYIADAFNHRIRRVGPDGIITTVAGNGIGNNYNGDGGPATAAEVGGPFDVAVGPDGSLFITVGSLIRRVGTDGIITTIAGGNGTPGFSGDGGPATAARISSAVRIAVGPDGSLFFVDQGNLRIRRIGTDGIITTVAGNGSTGSSGDGGPATDATFTKPGALAVGPDGSLFIGDGPQQRVRRVGPDGIISTVAGSGPGNGYYGGDAGPATAAILTNYDFRAMAGLAVAPDGRLYVSDLTRIRLVRPVLPDFAVSDILYPSEDGREVYLFSSAGRHLKTLDALTGAERYVFGYDAQGYATAVTDGSGNVTSIERTGANATAIVAPGGQRTTLNIGAGGWLLSVSNPASEAHTLTYSADGLLQTFTDPRGKLHQFTYDGLGRLTKDENPAGGSTTLARTEQANGYTVTTTTALGRSNVFQVEQLASQGVRRTVTSESGLLTTTVVNADDSEQTTFADGSTRTVKYAPDPRWGMLVPVAKSEISTTPGGRTRTLTTVRTATLSDPNNLLSLTGLIDAFTDNGVASTRVYANNGTTRTLTDTFATARGGTITLDALGRVTREQAFGLDPVTYAYDGRGLINTVVEGSGGAARNMTLVYNAAFEFTGFTDALGRTTGLSYDSTGRPVTVTLPGARNIALGYDASGNMTAVTPPGKSAHQFSYSNVDEIAGYTAPDLGSGATVTQLTYDADRALTQAAQPGGQMVDFSYDAGGRPSAVTLARGTIGYSYDPTTGHLIGVTAPGGLGLTYTRDSELFTAIGWSGAVMGNTSYTYDNDLRITAEDVNGGNSVNFIYAADGLLNNAGDLAFTRNAQNGLLTGSTLGNVADSHSYNTLAEHSAYSASYSGSAIYGAGYTRDALGRITQMIETIGGATTTYGYGYDAAGRLNAVSKDAVAVSSYTYDLNGNRIARTGPAVAASYDAQDRMTGYGGTTYTYTASGELLSKANGTQITTYQYDALGNLLNVTLPNASAIDYLIDGRNRRIGKKVNGTLVQGFLYQGALRPVAELDGNNSLVSRFVYGTQVNVPDYLIKSGVTYRIVTDRLGSPRLVVDVATGNVAQRLDYDEFGRVLSDTNPGFQPFGFAGGLYDKDTKLVRFGARDYDAETGRWTAKDPIAFAGADTNLYAYVGGDPVNFVDSKGLRRVRIGGCLYVNVHDTRVLRTPNVSGVPVTDLVLGDEVRWLGYDAATGFDRVEVTLPGGRTVEGYVLRNNYSGTNLSTEPPSPEVPDGGKPMSSQSFPSSGVATKA